MARNHLVTGNVTYTTVGTPTIVDGIMTGGSGRVDIIDNSSINLWAQNSFEIVYAFKVIDKSLMSGTIGTVYAKRLDGTGAADYGLYYASAESRLYIWFGFPQGENVHSNEFTYSLDNNKKYIFKFLKENGLGSIQVSVDDAPFTAIASNLDISNSTYDNATQRIFSNSGCEILLNECYIKINGAAWFGKCPVEVKHINYGALDHYYISGNPTISNGLLKNTGSGNYLAMTQMDIFSNDSFEYVASFHTGNAFPSEGYIVNMPFKSPDSTTRAYGTYVGGSSLYIYGGIDISNNILEHYLTLTVNTDYAIKWKKQNGVITTSLKVGNNDWQQILTDDGANKTSNPDMHSIVLGGANMQDGYINLNSTYININDSMWFFKPCVNYQKHNGKLVFADAGLYIQEPGSADYTVVGNPTISNGVVSGFSQSNYLTIDKAPTAPITSIEIVLDLTMPQTFNNEYDTILARKTTDKYAPMFQIRNGGALYIFVYDNYGSQAFIGAHSLSSHFQIKLAGDNSTRLYVYQRPDSSSEWVVQYDDFWRGMTWDADLIIGNNAATTGFFEGAINLNESYIKINGQMWWSGAGGAGTKVYASQNIAPVPAGYPLGDSTTPSIGYVDMRTQTFTAAPAGSTIGRDE